MKKTLIAIAALAATGAFAQSTVTISGLLDMGYLSTTTQATATADNKVQTFGMNNTGTSAVNISITEDLGGGMRASGFLETNPQVNGSATGTGPLLAAGATINGDATSTFAGGQRFVGLSGDWGGVKLGAPNSAVLQAAAGSQPFGTAMGGGYSSTFSVTGMGAGVRDIRSANSMRYDTPVIGGFSGSYTLSFNNKDNTNTDTSTGATVLGLNYSAGPLNVMYANGGYKNGGTANNLTSLNTLTANYTFGATTVYVGVHNARLEAAGVQTAKTSATNLAVKHAMGATTLLANMAKRTDKQTAVADNGDVTGLGADYALSKRTNLYGRYEKFEQSSATAATGKRTAYSFGIKHTF